jgi:excisionase family DNA binding protein
MEPTYLKPIAVTIPTARKISGLGNTTVWKLIAEKKLTTVKVGRRVLITYQSLEQLLAPGTPAPSENKSSSSRVNPSLSAGLSLPRSRTRSSDPCVSR